MSSRNLPRTVKMEDEGRERVHDRGSECLVKETMYWYTTSTTVIAGIGDAGEPSCYRSDECSVAFLWLHTFDLTMD